MIEILLPAYNEEEALRTLIPSLHSVLKENSEPHRITVVNDGSRDGTSDLLARFAQSMPVREVKHEKNRGYGAALGTGFHDLIRENHAPDSIVISLDADGTHDAEYIPAMIAKIRDGWDVVTASYTMPGGAVAGVPRYRAILSSGVNVLFRILCPVPGARTYSNGFRAYRMKILDEAAARYSGRLIEESGFSGGAELFLKAAACGARVAEIPFTLHYERRGKDSKIRFLPTIRGYLKLIFRFKSAG